MQKHMKIYEYKLKFLLIVYFYLLGLSTVISGIFLLLQIKKVPIISQANITDETTVNAISAFTFSSAATSLNASNITQVKNVTQTRSATEIDKIIQRDNLLNFFSFSHNINILFYTSISQHKIFINVT